MKTIILSIVILLAHSIVAHAGSPCESEAQETLWDLEIDAELFKVKKVKFNTKSSKVSSYRHWYKTSLCPKGYVIVHTTATCKTFDTYTQNGCYIEGLKAW